jgi:hypothetical protein
MTRYPLTVASCYAATVNRPRTRLYRSEFPLLDARHRSGQSCRDVYRSFAFPFEPWPPPDREPERLRLELFCTPLFLPVPDGPGRFMFFFAPDAMLFALSFTVAPLLAA